MDENAKKLILNRLRLRNKKQSDLFAELIEAHTSLLEKSENYKQKNIQLTVEVERIKLENIRLQTEGVSLTGGNAQGLEQKLFKLQEELTTLHRERGKNSQQIIDLNNAMQEKEKEIHAKDNKIHELENKIYNIEEAKKNLEQSILELSTTNQMLTDEQQALQLAFTSLEGKFRELQEEYNGLVSRWIALKAQDAHRLNDNNQKFYEEKQQKVAKLLEDAAEEEKFVKLPSGPIGAGPAMPAVCFSVSIPNTALCKFIQHLPALRQLYPDSASLRPDTAVFGQDAHDGEVNAVRWTASGRLFATGGADRKLKLWEVINGKCENRGILAGSNAAIMSVDFDSEENTVLAASNDFACRVWTLTDQRLRHTLTGHSAKVLAAKYMGDPNKVVSGSHDRTLKIWDLRSRVCVKTIFAGSSCNDLITTGDYSNTIISGHFDKKVRFWDTRSDSSGKEIALGGKVVSVDLSPDRTTLLACSRDETIKLIDLRMNQVSGTLSADGFRTSCDWTRAVFSPDGAYIMAGSADSSLYVWNVARKRVEKTLKDHQQAIIACSWHPNGSMLLSCDKQKQVILWSDF